MSDTEVPRIKVCGVTSLDDARLVADAGADALGLIYARSVRRVAPEVAVAVVAQLRSRLWCVGVFRHQGDDEILAVVERDALDAVQLHDPASDRLMDSLDARAVRVIRAVTARDPVLSERERDTVVAVLVDGPRPGSGEANDWAEVSSLRFRVPMIVAGGLDPDTVADVVREVQPWGVDVASGVESAPGIKDPARVTSFVGRARAALTQKGAP